MNKLLFVNEIPIIHDDSNSEQKNRPTKKTKIKTKTKNLINLI